VENCDVFEWLRDKIVDTRQIRPELISMESSLGEDLIPDSFEMIEIVAAIENRYGIRVEFEEFSEMETVRDVVDFIQDQVAAK